MPLPTAFVTIPGLFALGTIFINVLIIAVIAKSRRLREDSTYKAIVSWSLCDLGSGVFVMGMTVVIATVELTENDHRRIVTLHGCCTSLFGSASPWHLAVISLIKCVKVIRPLTFWSILSERRQIGLLAAIWSLSACLAMLPLVLDYGFFFSRDSFVTYRMYFGSFVWETALGFVIPSTIIVGANLRLFFVVRNLQLVSTDAHAGYLLK